MKLPAVLALLSSLVACNPRGFPTPPASPAVDPPARVARLSYLQGPVSFKAAGTDEWVAAELNRPLTTADALWTDQGARAELTFGSAAIRLDARTGISFLNLDDHTIQIKLSQGAIRLNVRAVEGDETFEVDTPAAAISVLRTGDYRFDANADTTATRILVRAGMVDVPAAAQPFVVRANQEAVLAAAGAAPDIRAAGPLDAFDDFCASRERPIERAEAPQYVSPRVIGWEDLDPYGSWEADVTYGPLWIPRTTPPGWAPYRFGHWVWIEPWGWTWIDDTPWGFAPFHYGRWVFLRTRWCWVPGPPRVRVVFAPALVVFVGGPGLRYHVRVGVDIGIGWFPLGPHEIYVPPYRASRAYLTSVNVGHTVIRDPANIHRVDVSRQVYRNRAVAGAITAVPERDFLGGRRISQNAVPVAGRDAEGLRIHGTAPPVAPDRRSITGDAEQRSRAARPPQTTERRQVVTRQTPATPPPSIEQRQDRWKRDPGRPQPSPQAQPQPQPQNRRAEDRTNRESEQRRRTIDREHQRDSQSRRKRD